MKLFASLLLFCCSTLSSPAGAELVPVIVLDNVPLVDAVKNLARQSGLNYIVAPHVNASPMPSVNVRMTNVTAREALGTLLKEHKLTMVTNPATSVMRIAPARLGVKPVPASQVGTNSGAVFPMVAMEDVPLTEAISNLAGAAQLSVSVDPKWSAAANQAYRTVSFRWEKISARQALAALLDAYELVLIEDPGKSTARIALKSEVEADRKDEPEKK